MNAFDWKQGKSELAEALKEHPGRAIGGAASGNRFRQYDPAREAKQNTGKRMPGLYLEQLNSTRNAVISLCGITATQRETEIKRCRKEIPRHEDLAKFHPSEFWRFHHAFKVSELTNKVAQLIALRPAGYVEKS